LICVLIFTMSLLFHSKLLSVARKTIEPSGPAGRLKQFKLETEQR
jgi:hypothetical protein